MVLQATERAQKLTNLGLYDANWMLWTWLLNNQLVSHSICKLLKHNWELRHWNFQECVLFYVSKPTQMPFLEPAHCTWLTRISSKLLNSFDNASDTIQQDS